MNIKEIIEYLLLSGFVYHKDNEIYKGKTNHVFLTKPYSDGNINIEVETRTEDTFVVSVYVFPHVGTNKVKHFVPFDAVDIITELKNFLYIIENEHKFKGIT